MLRNNDEKLENIHNRIEKLEKLIGKVREDRLSILYAQKNFDVPWEDIHLRIENSRNEKRDDLFLEAVKTGLVHLEKKNNLLLSKGNKAFSELAMRIDAYSGTPLVGGLFSSFSNIYRNQGINKQSNRLGIIEACVGELEEKYPVSIYQRFMGRG